MTSPQQSALIFLQALLKQWDLDELGGAVSEMLVAGDGPDVIPIKLRETEPYKRRFAGNAARIKAGLPALSEAEYLSTEAQLRNVIRRYVGSGEYDTRQNLEKWIGKDVSPQELNDRMALYRENYLQQPQAVRDAWAAHGFTTADAIKSIMDPAVNETTLARKATIYSLGGASVQAYRDDRALDVERLGELADAGVTAQRAREGYSEIAAREEYEGFLARQAGETLTRRDQEDAALLEDQTAQRKRRKVLATAQGEFEENRVGGLGAVGRLRSGNY